MQSFPFYGPCPSCGGNNRYHWVHSFCGGPISITENCFLRCNFCNKTDFIINWRFECANHRGQPHSVSGFQLIDSISHVCRNSNIPDYIKRNMINILNNIY